MSTTHPEAQQAPSGARILLASGVALVVAAVVLLTAVLPAEYGIDPLGTGKLFGIAGLSSESLPALNKQNRGYQRDTYTIELAPFESLEYKYRLEEGATMVFDWRASGELFFDLHSEKDGVDPQEYSPSFDQRQSRAEQGSYTAPFPGIHGWFWENRSTSPVTLELNTVGFFSKATEFRAGFENHREFE